MNDATTTTENPTRRMFTRELRVKLNEAEVTERGRKLAARRSDRAQLDEKRKAVAKDYGGQLAQIDAELDGLQSAIQTGSELRPGCRVRSRPAASCGRSSATRTTPAA